MYIIYLETLTYGDPVRKRRKRTESSFPLLRFPDTMHQRLNYKLLRLIAT